MVVYKFRNRKQCLCCLPGCTNRGHCNVGNQDQRMSSCLWEQNSPWWETVTWSCVYVNTSPCHPKSDDWSVFFPPSTTLWSNDIVIFTVEACLSLITYQAEVLIWSAADQLIKVSPARKSLATACHRLAKRDVQKSPCCSPGGSTQAWKTHLIPPLSMATESDNDHPSAGRGWSCDSRSFWGQCMNNYTHAMRLFWW